MLWLAPPTDSTAGSTKLALTDLTKRKELLCEFLYWLFDSFIIHLIRSNFYVTETAVHRTRVFYFRYDVWKAISEPSIIELKHRMLEEIPKVCCSATTNFQDQARTILSNPARKSMGFSFLRFLPKERGVRCITNLRRKAYKFVLS